jgi:hypothetical protein
MGNTISLTPGFSPVMTGHALKPFQRFFSVGKPLKRLVRQEALGTRLKPGVNENLVG